MTGAEAAENHDLIQGMCFIKEKTLNVLYDSGATKSFISSYCVKHLNMSTSFLKTTLVVSTPTNDSIITNKVCLDYPLFIKNRKFLVNFICLPLSELDVIFGMDWLSSNQVLLNCAEKLVTFPNSKNLLKSPTNSKSEPLRNKIQCYLLLYSIEIKEEVELKNIAVVQSFPEVFPNDIPSLPPNREIDFSINLMLGTGPISIAPYRMSPYELAKLKKQLEELLEK